MKKKNGFTLIELLIVIAVISFLALAFFTILNPSRLFQKANDSKRKEDLKQVQQALENYLDDNGEYPVSLTWGASFGSYFPKLPLDPDNPERKYDYKTTGDKYYMYASLERAGEDAQACNNGVACLSISANGFVVDCGGTCDFGLTSPNTTP